MKKLYLIRATQEQEMTFGQMMTESSIGKGEGVKGGGPTNPISGD